MLELPATRVTERRFLLDEDISPDVSVGLRLREIDAVSVHEIDRRGLSDEEQLEFATQEGRVIVTYNRDDFQAIDSDWRETGRSHAGILWCVEKSLPRRDIGGVITRIESASKNLPTMPGLCLPMPAAPESD